MERCPKYTLTHEAWQRVQDALPYFTQFFALTDSGIGRYDNHPEYQRLWREVMASLGIEPDMENTLSALMRICPAAQYARGLLEAEEDESGVWLLFEARRH